MDFSLSEDQEMIKEMVRKFLENEYSKEKIRELMGSEKGHDPEIWNKMLELGWMGLIIPEEYGGTGMGYLDLLIVMEEMGRNIILAPFFPTVALCSIPILKYAREEQKKRYLPGIAIDGKVWTLALLESSGEYKAEDTRTEAILREDEYILNGTKLFVPYANVADYLLVVARTNDKGDHEKGMTVFIVESDNPGVETQIIPTTAHDMRCEVTFHDVNVPKDNVLGEINKGWDIVEYIIQYATVLKCAEIAGSALEVVNITNQYAKERIQFDSPIGSFQAVQHRLVNMFMEAEGLKLMVYEAAWKLADETPSRALISMAKAKANETHQRLCLDGILSHGAIGFTEEMNIGLYHVRTKAFEFELGDSDFHRERAADELGNYEPEFLNMW